MRVAVIGAGITGLVAARRISLAGHEVEVFERWPGLGGQVATLDVGGLLLERYYHHLFPTDKAIASLYEELGMPDAIDWLPSSVAVHSHGASRPFSTPLDLLRFDPLPPAARVRTGLAVLALQLLHKDASRLEGLSARQWVETRMGAAAYRELWGPLLEAKFGPDADSVSMPWLWSKLTLRRRVDSPDGIGTEVLGYPHGGWQPLLDRLSREIAGHGGRVRIDCPAAAVGRGAGGGLEVTAGAGDSWRAGHDPRAWSAAGPAERFDAVVSTVPSDVFLNLLSAELRGELGAPYAACLAAARYHGARCLLLELDRGFGDHYWTNVTDPKIPFIGVIEQRHLVGSEALDGRHFLYVANYRPPGDPLFELSHDQLLASYDEGLRRLNPDWSSRWVVDRWSFTEPAAQPIVTVGQRHRIPPLRTPAPGLWVANTQQIYPEDRGTNYSVVLGERVAGELLRDLG